MSTISTIIKTPSFELYEETCEPIYIDGIFTGYNVYLIIENIFFRRVTIEGVRITVESEVKEYLPDIISFWAGDVLKVEADADGLLLVIKGGTRTAEYLKKKDFAMFCL